VYSEIFTVFPDFFSSYCSESRKASRQWSFLF